MKIFAIDPGNEFSAYCVMDDEYKLIDFAKLENIEVMQKMFQWIPYVDLVVIERMMSYSTAVGRTTFETCEWIGRFAQEAEKETKVDYVYRKDEKIYICGTIHANDTTIKHALIDRFAKFDFKTGKGTAKNKDYFYGVSKDTWQAIAICTTKFDMIKEKAKNEKVSDV